jgi:hypothetical protein
MVDIVTRLGKGSPLTNAEVDANFTNLAEVSGVTGEPMGHEDRTTSTISFNASTRTFTIAPTASSFTVWCKGKKVVVSSAQTVVIPNTTGMYSIYFDSTGALAAKAGYFTFAEEAPTAYVYWNATTGTAPYFGDERHGVVLDWQTHEYLHRTRGAALASGFSASGYVLGGNGSSNSHAQLTIEGGTFFDEDMKIIVTATNTPTAGTWEQDLTSPARIPVLYLSGTAWVIDAPTDYPLKQGTARPQYNAYSGGVWSTADVANNKYSTTWILATNNLTYPVIAIIGQAESDLQSAAEAVDFTELQLPGFPSVEFRPLYKLIFQCADSCTNAVHASLVSITDIRSIAAAGTAASIVTDHGNLSGLSDDDHPQYLSVDTVRGSLTAAVKASFLPSQTSNAGKFLQTDGTATSWQALTSGNVTTALGFTPYNATNPSGFITGITSGNVTTALGFTPYNATNPSGYVNAAGARGAISVTGAGSYDSATGVINIVGGVTSFNTRTGAITLSSSDVTTALGFTPYNSTNPNGYLTGITSTQVTTALGYTPYNSSNPSGYITGITSGMVTTALGFTPYNNSNPSGYITSSALSGYLTSASAASTYLPLSGGTLSGELRVNTIRDTAGGWVLGKYGTEVSLGSAGLVNEIRFNSSANAAFEYRGNAILHAGNYNSYSPTLTGTGASGTWGINITGTASGETLATVTARGGSTSSGVVLANTGNHYSGHFYYDAYDAAGNHYPHFQSGSNGTGATINWRVFNASGSYITHYWDKNSTEFANNVRAPSFYDSNDTAYYVDPNGDSRLSGLSVGRGPGGSTAGNLYIKGNHSWRWIAGYAPDYGVGNGFGLYSDTNGAYYLSLSTAGNWWFGVNDHSSSYRVSINGTGYASSDFRAPIFYDSNDTTYYLDPNSTTAALLAGSIGLGTTSPVNSAWGTASSTKQITVYGSAYGVVNIRGDSTTATHYSMGVGDGRFYAAYDNVAATHRLVFFGSFTGLNYGSSPAYNLHLGGTGLATGDWRAPIFYDSDDTAFAVNPNGTSAIRSQTVGYNGSSLAYDTAASGKLYFGSSGSDAPDYYNISTAMQNYGGNYTKLDFRWYTGQRFYAHSAYGGFRFHEITTGTQIFSINEGGSYAAANQSMRAPIFYDLDNTNYFVDPAATTSASFAGFVGIGGNYGSDDSNWGARLNVGGTPHARLDVRAAGDGIITTMYSHNGQNRGYMGTMSNHRLALGVYGSEVQTVYSSYSETVGSYRAPIFYDSSNTAYYTDPTSTSRMDRLYVGNGAYAEIVLSDDESPNGIKYVHANGNNIGFLSGSGSWIFRVDNGGTGIAESSLRAPIFYDYNDTGYYFDGASTSRVNRIDFTNLYLASDTNYGFIGSSVYADTLNSGYAGDQLELNYVRGTWAGISHSSLRAPIFYDYNDTGTYINPNGGSVISSGGSYPMEFRSSQRYITRFWNQGASSYGWWLANDANSIVFHADSIGDKASLDTSGNFTATGSSRAPIFYDSENTGYYSNPNGGSQFNAVYLEGSGNNRAIGKTHSGSDFPNGTLVQTNIWAADWAGASFVMEVTGKSYSSSPPFSFMVQGYLYADTIINCSAINHGTPISYVKVFNYNNYLCFWWPRWGYWNSFEVRVRDAGGDSANRVTSITDSVLPSGSKMVEPGLFNTALYGYNQGGNLYASAYYDNNDTGYYTDPHSTSRLNYVIPSRIKLVNNVNNEPRWDFSAYVVEAQHWYGNNSSQTMYLGEANWVNIRNTADIHGDVRSPIYYDRNDTTYYADLNSTGTSIRAAGNITAYYSDMRLKTHLGKIENARDKVRQLEGFYYEANELAQSFGYKAKREVGVSAQAVQAVLPEIVTDAPINSNYLTIDYERLTPLLIEAIKEQDTELVDLRNRVAQLESLINKLIGD